MRPSTDIDDQMLGAFVDGQLDSANCALIIKAVENDPEVRERLYQLRRAKDLMKLGFDNAQPPRRPMQEPKTSLRTRLSFGIAASLVTAAVGFGTGIFGYSLSMQLAEKSSTQVLANASQQYADRVVLHISDSDPEHFGAALAYTKEFLKTHQKQGSEIEVVANAGGLDLMREGISPYERQVIELMRDHNNVHFIACANGIRSLKNKGIQPGIIEEIGTDETAMDHIISRLQDGWTYVKVESLPEI
ncbi:hypothetical protein [Thiogranum longum]